MSIPRDLSVASDGDVRIKWAEARMRVHATIRSRLSSDKAFGVSAVTPRILYRDE